MAREWKRLSTLKNSQTQEELSIDNATSDGTGFLVEDENTVGKYSYIPLEDTQYEVSPYLGYDTVSAPEVPVQNFGSLNFSPDLDNDGVIKNVVAYNFGIDSVKVGFSASYETTGFVSEKINIDSCSYLQVELQTEKGDTSIEVYILDDGKELPILPLNGNYVADEKIFQDLPTRFVVDEAESVTIKKDGEVTNLNLNNINNTTVLDSDAVYTVSYFPREDSDKVFPTSKEIQVKIIQREYSFCTKQTIIKAVTIKKFGGKIPWLTQE